MTRRLDPGRVRFEHGDDPNPFVRYRTLFGAYHLARSSGWADADYVALVERLDRAVAEVDGHGFEVTPFARSDALSDRLGFSDAGGVLVKDETRNVSGSHKARHLMATLLGIEVGEAAGGIARRPLAVASCGNAALAAAVVARAGGRALEVFIPTDADPAVVTRLRDLDARITVCERTTEMVGDPTYRRLGEALAAGALPFTCQGNLNGLAIEGGETLGYEIIDDLSRLGIRLDRLFIQVGGGALASSCIQAFDDARRLGQPVEVPRFHAVQTRGAFPLERAYRRLADRLAGRVAGRAPASGARKILPSSGAGQSGNGFGDESAGLLRAAMATGAGREELRYAAHHRAAFMWPWEAMSHSVAAGILDDETYDWLAIVGGMLASGGYPVVAAEETLVVAHELARSTTGIDVDPTGSAGLAGLLELVSRGAIRPDGSVAVLFTGRTRGTDGTPGVTREPDIPMEGPGISTEGPGILDEPDIAAGQPNTPAERSEHQP